MKMVKMVKSETYSNRLSGLPVDLIKVKEPDQKKSNHTSLRKQTK